jgi:hypothetical protein
MVSLTGNSLVKTSIIPVLLLWYHAACSNKLFAFRSLKTNSDIKAELGEKEKYIFIFSGLGRQYGAEA